jgi:exopolysaccharide biosynthesis polyprenyl glycosylphosphotransferase
METTLRPPTTPSTEYTPQVHTVDQPIVGPPPPTDGALEFDRTAPWPATAPALVARSPGWDNAVSTLEANLRCTFDTACVLVAWAIVVAATAAQRGSLAVGSAWTPTAVAYAIGLLAVTAVAVPTVSTFFATQGLYDPRSSRTVVRDVFEVLKLTAAASAALLLPLVMLGVMSLERAVGCWLLGASAPIGVRLVRHARAAGAAPRRVLVVGSGPRARQMIRQLHVGAPATEVLGCVDTPDRMDIADAPAPMLASLDDLDELLMRTEVDEVLIALPVRSRHREIQCTIGTCERAGVECKHLADVFEFGLARPRLETAGTLSLISMPVACGDYRLVIKRGLDVVGALAGIVLLSPLLLGIATAIRLSSPGPAIFSQPRFGYRKRRFMMYKFRTMVCDAEAQLSALEGRNEATGAAFKIRDDPRVTRFGRYLRRSSLDELPQLFNVLKGDMSLVGPRPMTLRDVGRFTEPWLMRRFSVRPGLTCLWQIGGRCKLPFDDWMRLDLLYIDRWSLSLDLYILLRTLPTVVRGAGAT